jgi:hypothetical protein
VLGKYLLNQNSRAYRRRVWKSSKYTFVILVGWIASAFQTRVHISDENESI